MPRGKSEAQTGKKKSTKVDPSEETEDAEVEEAEVDAEDAEVDAEDAEAKPRVRRKPTIEEHIKHYAKVLEIIDLEIDGRSRRKEKGTRAFRTIRKLIIQMKKEVPVISHYRLPRNPNKDRSDLKSGLMMRFPISKELADFLQVPTDTVLSRLEATCAICVYSYLKDDEDRESMLSWKYLNPDCKRNLQNPQDKRAIIPDKALTKLLRYDQYKKSVAKGLITKKTKNKETGVRETVTLDNDFLYYWVMQKLLSVHFLKNQKTQ